MNLQKIKQFVAILQKKAQITTTITDDKQKTDVTSVLNDESLVQDFITLLNTNEDLNSAFFDKLNRTGSFDFSVEVQNGGNIIVRIDPIFGSIPGLTQTLTKFIKSRIGKYVVGYPGTFHIDLNWGALA